MNIYIYGIPTDATAQTASFTSCTISSSGKRSMRRMVIVLYTYGLRKTKNRSNRWRGGGGVSARIALLLYINIIIRIL